MDRFSNVSLFLGSPPLEERRISFDPLCYYPEDKAWREGESVASFPREDSQDGLTMEEERC